jgi:hypothetical protein
MRFPWACFSLCAGLLGGCSDLQPQPTVNDVEPDRAYSNGDVHLTLVGSGFVPATQLDPGSGRRIAVSDGFAVQVGTGATWVQLTNLQWQSTERIEGLLPSSSAQGFAPGFLDVQLTDPRGGTAWLPGGFRELGPDDSAPTITFLAPAANTPFAAGMPLNGSFRATDALPGTLAEMDWVYYENGFPIISSISSPCTIPLDASEADCSFAVTVSADLTEVALVWIDANATDEANNTQTKRLPFELRARPSVASISPASGGMDGGTDVVIKGSGFLAGSWATLDGELLVPDGGIVVDPNTLSGYVPAHEVGDAAVVVHTPIGATPSVMFTYLPRPTIVAITPSTGDPTGGTLVTITGLNFTLQTQISFGLTLDSAVPLQGPSFLGDTSISGFSPLGTGPTSVWAVDGELGWSQLPDGFSWSSQ